MMELVIPPNFESEFYSRSCLFAKYAIGSGEDQDYQLALRNAQVAISGSRQILATANGQYMVTMVANLLARFCGHLALVIPDNIPLVIHTPITCADSLLPCLVDMTTGINPLIRLDIVPEHKGRLYDAALVVGQVDSELGRTTYINSDGWLAYIDTEGNPFLWRSNNPNPIGAYAAACLGSAEIFKAITHRLDRKGFATASSGSYVFSTLDYGFRQSRLMNPKLPEVELLEPLYMISMGAINSAVLYTLCSIPKIKAKAFVVEPETCDISNLNRYLLLRATNAAQAESKCSVAQRTAQRYLDIEVYRESYENHRPHLQLPINIALVGVDNDETRWHVQDDLPKVLLCGGTGVSQVRISRHDNPFTKACLGCIYPKTDGPAFQVQPEAVPSISFVSALTGVLLAGELTKGYTNELLPYVVDICLDLNVLNMPHFGITKPVKSTRCGCNCQKWTLAQ